MATRTQDATTFEQLSSELVRGWRGDRTQLEASRALGLRSNVFSAWERAVAAPPTSRALKAARLGGRPVQRLTELVASDWTERIEVDSRDGVALFLGDLVGGRTVRKVADQAAVSRHALSRYLNAQAEPTLPVFLRLLDACGKLWTALDVLVEGSSLEAVPWTRHLQEQTRQTYASAPMLGDVHLMLYLDAYQALPAHEPGWIGDRLGIEVAEEQAALDELVERSLAIQEGDRYRPATGDVFVRFEGTPAEREVYKAWLQRQLFTGKPVVRTMNTCLMSRAEAREVGRILQRAIDDMNGIVGATSSTECLAYTCVSFALPSEEP